MALTIYNDPSANANAGTYATQARPDKVDFDIIAAAHSGTAVYSGCAVTPHNSGVDLNVAVAAGTVMIAGASVAVAAAANVTVTAANGANPRRDLVVVNNAGTVSVTAGVAAVVPCLPNVPANSVALAAVEVPAAATSITAANLTDKRVFDLFKSYATRLAARALSS